MYPSSILLIFTFTLHKRTCFKYQKMVMRPQVLPTMCPACYFVQTPSFCVNLCGFFLLAGVHCCISTKRRWCTSQDWSNKNWYGIQLSRIFGMHWLEIMFCCTLLSSFHIQEMLFCCRDLADGDVNNKCYKLFTLSFIVANVTVCK